MPANTQRPSPSGSTLRSARNISNMLALWSLCRERKCRKAGECCVARITCWHGCLDLVPGPVLAFVFGLFEIKEEEKLGFDDALATIPEPWREEFTIWHRAVSRITGQPSYGAPAKRAPPARSNGAGKP